MPLIDRADTVLVVVDTQPGFFAKDDPAATAAVDQAISLATIARLLGIPAVVTEEAPEREGPTEPLRRMAQLGVELVHAKGVAFEWMRTVDVAIDTTRAARP